MYPGAWIIIIVCLIVIFIGTINIEFVKDLNAIIQISSVFFLGDADLVQST